MPDTPTPESPIDVVLSASGAEARGRFDGSGVTVLAGSRGRAEPVASYSEGFHKRRERLFTADVIGRAGPDIVFNVDHHFTSPSGAAIILMGRHANGWIDWTTPDGTPIDVFRGEPWRATEIEYRRRFYEAHVARYSADDFLDESVDRQERFTASAHEALELLAALDRTRDVDAFAEGMRKWAVKPTTLAFNGFSGQAMINQLVKHSGRSDADVAAVLVEALSVPDDRDEARSKIDRLVGYIEEIRVGQHPGVGHAPFLVSYFWALADHASWATIWSSAGSFAEYLTGQAFPSDPADRYLAFLDVVESLDDDYERFEGVSVWWHETKPVLLDGVLSERCAYGLDDTTSSGAKAANASVLVATAKHIGDSLVDEVSSVVGRSMSARRLPKEWRKGEPRSDLRVVWSAHETGIGLRLWVNPNGASIGLHPGWVRKGWYDEVASIVESRNLPGFRMIGGEWSTYGEEVGNTGGGKGEFDYARWYDADQLADLDLESEVTDIAVALQPLIDELIQSATGVEAPEGDDPLAEAVADFIARGYPTSTDEENRAERARFREILLPDAIALADPAELRRIWNTSRYGNPGPQSILNTSFRDADDAEYDRIVDTIRYVCWGADGGTTDVAERIDRVLDTEGDLYVKGLGESVVMKLLAICHPERFVPTFPYSGPKGKRRMLQVLDLPEPVDTSRGEIQVEANDLIRKRLDGFFPGDPWGIGQFLYRYMDRLDDVEPVAPDVDPIEELAAELLVGRSFLDDIIALLDDKKQVILYGPPGTGKTYLAQKLAEALVPDPTRRSLVQFHPSTSYEDFFEGYRPETSLDGDLSYRLTPGPLALLAARAADAPGKRHLMIIDEINRANLPRVLGELLFLLEYRNTQVPTLYRPDDPFELPEDLWFIGTMNTADRSIALIDAALRRRFHFIPFFPNTGAMSGLLDRWLEAHSEPAWVGELLSMVNDQLTAALNGPHLQIGPSYFMKPNLDREAVRLIWEYNIEPFIEDQFFGDPAQIEHFRFRAVLAEYLSSVDVASLDELEAARAADAGGVTSHADLVLGDGGSSQLDLDGHIDDSGEVTADE